MAKDSEQLVYAEVDLAAGGTLTIAAAADERVRLVNMLTTMTADGTVLFESGATALTGAMTYKAGAGPAFRSSVKEPFLTTLAAGDDLKITATTGGLDGFIAYYIEGA